MAKKKTNRKKRADAAAEPAVKFDDAKYGDVRFSATYRYGELDLYKAAAYLGGPRVKLACYLGATVCIVAMIGVILVDSRNLLPAVILLFISLIFTAVTSNWANMQVYYARNSTLDPHAAVERRHVVMTADALIEAREDGAEERYDLADLRRVASDDEGLVAAFGQKRYVYVPAQAMSTSRFGELERALRGAKG